MNVPEYLLTCLIEECAEVQQRATKALRFGLHEVQPGQDLDNLMRLRGELNDLFGVLELAREMGHPLVDRADPDAVAAKKRKVLEFMQYSKDVCGTLTVEVVSHERSS